MCITLSLKPFNWLNVKWYFGFGTDSNENLPNFFRLLMLLAAGSLPQDDEQRSETDSVVWRCRPSRARRPQVRTRGLDKFENWFKGLASPDNDSDTRIPMEYRESWNGGSWVTWFMIARTSSFFISCDNRFAAWPRNTCHTKCDCHTSASSGPRNTSYCAR